jgi:hypothetical protein
VIILTTLSPRIPSLEVPPNRRAPYPLPPRFPLQFWQYSGTGRCRVRSILLVSSTGVDERETCVALVTSCRHRVGRSSVAGVNTCVSSRSRARRLGPHARSMAPSQPYSYRLVPPRARNCAGCSDGSSVIHPATRKLLRIGSGRKDVKSRNEGRCGKLTPVPFQGRDAAGCTQFVFQGRRVYPRTAFLF